MDTDQKEPALLAFICPCCPHTWHAHAFDADGGGFCSPPRGTVIPVSEQSILGGCRCTQDPNDIEIVWLRGKIERAVDILKNPHDPVLRGEYALEILNGTLQ
jgi:hypothetical protein